MNKINFVYRINNDNYMLAAISMQSIIEHHKNLNINFYLCSNEQFNIENLKTFEFINTYSNSKVKYINIKSYIFNKIRDNVHLDYNYNLFAIQNYIPESRVICLEASSIVNENLEKFFNMDLENYSCAAVEHIYANISQNEMREKKNVYFQILTLLADLDKWRSGNVLNKCLELDFETFAKGKINYCQMFNMILNNECKQVDYHYDYVERNNMWLGKNKELSCSKKTAEEYFLLKNHIKIPKIINLFGENPINCENCFNSYISLWWSYAEKTPIYNEIKQYRQLNKYKLSSTSAQNAFKYTWLLSRIFPYIKPYWFRILLGFLIAIPLGLLDGVTAFALKPYMDYVIGGKAFEYSWHGFDISISSLQMAYVIPIGVILFAALQGVLRYLNGYFSGWVSARITNDVKFDLFERLIHMHPQFFDDNSSGIVISRYMGDPGAASAGIVDNIKTITTSLCGALGLIAVMLYSSWQLAFIGVIVLCVAFVPVLLIRKRLKEASNKNMVIGGKITTNINETYSGNKVMTAYGLQDRQNKYFQEQVWKSYHIGMSLYKRAGWMSPMMYLIASCGIATVLGVGTYLINSGQMTAGAFASFVTSLLLLYKPVKTLGNTLTGIQNIFVAMGRVFELFDLTPAIVDCENPKEMQGLNNSITFDNITFEYVPNKPVLKNLNLNIKKNETLAIVGNSGGGKSTLVNLIPRFYDVKSGAVRFDGVDVKEFSLKSLRQNISMVFQDNFLFTGSIKENIMMGNPDATVEELMNAIKAAHLEEMIQELPDGLDTELGERGLTLSGGQRQRVAIARAMLRNAPIVILDEATSALDNESEAIVQKAMDNLMQNRTVFIIAHRLSTIKNADRIAVINEGELVELGTHEELINIENGQYKHLYEMQFKKQEIKG